MFDNQINNFLSSPKKNIAVKLKNFGFSANFLTFISFNFSLLTFVFIIMGYFNFAIIFFIMSRISDGFDGEVARLNEVTQFGGYIDIVSDFLGYAIIPFGFIIYNQDNSFAGSLLLVAFIGTSSTFLTFAIYKKELNEKKIKKSFYYSYGLIEGFETIIFFILILLFHEHFIFLTYFFSFLCFMTTLQRLLYAYYNLDQINE
tara:strand:- start:209 stop:814 length:606 start_codon:yes stop_codon:yes gene_type:complete